MPTFNYILKRHRYLCHRHTHSITGGATFRATTVTDCYVGRAAYRIASNRIALLSPALKAAGRPSTRHRLVPTQTMMMGSPTLSRGESVGRDRGWSQSLLTVAGEADGAHHHSRIETVGELTSDVPSLAKGRSLRVNERTKDRPRMDS